MFWLWHNLKLHCLRRAFGISMIYYPKRNTGSKTHGHSSASTALTPTLTPLFTSIASCENWANWYVRIHLDCSYNSILCICHPSNAETMLVLGPSSASSSQTRSAHAHEFGLPPQGQTTSRISTIVDTNRSATQEGDFFASPLYDRQTQGLHHGALDGM